MGDPADSRADANSLPELTGNPVLFEPEPGRLPTGATHRALSGLLRGRPGYHLGFAFARFWRRVGRFWVRVWNPPVGIVREYPQRRMAKGLTPERAKQIMDDFMSAHPGCLAPVVEVPVPGGSGPDAPPASRHRPVLPA